MKNDMRRMYTCFFCNFSRRIDWQSIFFYNQHLIFRKNKNHYNDVEVVSYFKARNIVKQWIIITNRIQEEAIRFF